MGKICETAGRLLAITKQLLYQGIEWAVISNRIDDISNVIQDQLKGEGYSVVRELVGYGIGRVLNEDLQVPLFCPGR